MSRLILISIATTLCVIGVSAQAQPDQERLDATVVSIDYADRTITVRFEQNDAVETYDVAKNAEFFTWDGVMEHPQKFTDIDAGEHIMLEFGGIEGHATLRKVISQTDEAS